MIERLGRQLLAAPVSPDAEYRLTLILISIYALLCVITLVFLIRMMYYRYGAHRDVRGLTSLADIT